MTSSALYIKARFDLVMRSDFWGVSQTIAIFEGPLGRSLHLIARTAHSTHWLHIALLCYACFARSLHSQACLFTSLTPLWNGPECAFTLKTRTAGTNAFFVVTRNTPLGRFLRGDEKHFVMTCRGPK